MFIYQKDGEFGINDKVSVQVTATRVKKNKPTWNFSFRFDDNSDEEGKPQDLRIETEWIEWWSIRQLAIIKDWFEKSLGMVDTVSTPTASEFLEMVRQINGHLKNLY